jgi:hypothetical protein
MHENIFDSKTASGSYERFLTLFQYLDLAFDIVNDFGLNTKIWGRED